MQDSLAKRVIKVLSDKKLFLATAESCTGGLLAVALTDEPGASRVFDRGFVTYSNEAKIQLLKVPLSTLEEYGAVSGQTAKAMAEGALHNNPKSSIAVSVTGIAGPDGGSGEKPVGLVFIAVARNNIDTIIFKHVFSRTRDQIRKKSVEAAFQHILDLSLQHE